MCPCKHSYYFKSRKCTRTGQFAGNKKPVVLKYSSYRRTHRLSETDKQLAIEAGGMKPASSLRRILRRPGLTDFN